MNRFALFIALLAVILMSVSPCASRATEPTDAKSGPQILQKHLEFQQDRPAPAVQSQPGPQPQSHPQWGHHISNQVNVGLGQLNIPNDAANEPSIAVDPTNPLHMSIVWRQFDNVNSNFRQAGYGFTTDEGRTWTFPGVLTPGVFRSDPVLTWDANGNFYWNSLKADFTTDVFKSTNGGQTWDRRSTPTAGTSSG